MQKNALLDEKSELVPDGEKKGHLKKEFSRKRDKLIFFHSWQKKKFLIREEGGRRKRGGGGTLREIGAIVRLMGEIEKAPREEKREGFLGGDRGREGEGGGGMIPAVVYWGRGDRASCS